MARRDQYLEKAEPIKIGLLLDNPQRSTDSAERIYDLVVDNYARSKRFERGFEFVVILHGDQRRIALEQLLAALEAVRRPADLAALPPNDLASSPLAEELLAAGAFRADVSGAGPAVYGLFVHERDATSAAQGLRNSGRVWITAPAWYG